MLELQKQVPTGDTAPIKRDDLRPGTRFSISGYQFQARGDRLGLTLFADLLGKKRTVTIPLSLGDKDVRHFVREMSLWLEKPAGKA